MDFGDGKMGKNEDDSQSREDEQKVTKNLQAIMLLKKKLARTDLLIRQFNDKTIECNALKEELATVKGDKQDLLNKYNVNLEMLTRLEMTTANFKDSVKNYEGQIHQHITTINENNQHINQLKYKIKDLEDEINGLQLEIKCTKTKVKVEKKPNVQVKEQAIQTDIKVCNSSTNTDPLVMQEKVKTKNQNTMTNPVKHIFKKPDVRDQAIMTESIEPIFKKPQMKHQNLMTESTNSILKKIETKNIGIETDECINAKNEPYPFYCSKCEILIQPAPVDQILKIMTAPPPLLSEYLSPPHSPTFSKPNIENYKEDTVISTGHNDDNDVTLSSLNYGKYENETLIRHENPCSAFMAMDKLSRKVSKLEKLVKKIKSINYENRCCHNNYDPSKNVKFIVKLPSEEKFFEYHKREKRKIKRLKIKKNRGLDKRTKNKRKNDSEKQSSDWKVENCVNSKKRKIVPDKRMDLNKKNKLSNQQLEELFECSAISDSDEGSNITTSPILETNQLQSKSINMESVSLSITRKEVNMDITKEPVDEQTLNLIELIQEDKVSSDTFTPSQSVEKSMEAMELPSVKFYNTNNITLANEQINVLTELSNNDTINYTENQLIDNDATSEEFAQSFSKTSLDAEERLLQSSVLDKVSKRYSTEEENNERNEESNIIDQITSFPNSDNILGKSVKENHNQDTRVENEKEKLISVKKYTCDSSEVILFSDNIISFKTCDLLTSEIKEDEKINVDINISNAEIMTNEYLSKEEINRQTGETEKIDEILNLPTHNNKNTLDESKNESHCPGLNKNVDEDAKKYLISCKESLNNSEDNAPSESMKNSDVSYIPTVGRETNVNINLDPNIVDNNLIDNSNVYNENKNSQNEGDNIDKVNDTDINQSLINQLSDTEQLAIPKVEKSFTHKNLEKLFHEFPSAQQFKKSQDKKDLAHKNIENINEERNPQINSKLVEDNLQRTTELPEAIQDSITHKSEENNLCATLDEKKITKNISVEENNLNITKMDVETTKENVSSDDSSESEFLSSTKKNRNNVNVTQSDESNEKPTDEPNTTKHKRSVKRLKTDKTVIPRKKLLTKIRNIKRISVKPITATQSEPSTSQTIPTSVEVPMESVTAAHVLPCVSNNNTSVDGSTPCLPIKKQRIAHTPKSISIIRNAETINQDQKTVTKVIKKIKLNSKSQVKESDDKISSILEVYDKTCKERAEISRNLNIFKSVQADSVSLRNLITNNVQIPRLPSEENKSNKSYTDLPIKDTTSNDCDVNSSLLPNVTTKDKNELISFKEEDKTVQSSVSNKTKLKKKTVNIDSEATNPIRALRSRQVVINEETLKTKKIKTRKLHSSFLDLPEINETNSSLQNTTIVSLLNEHISKQVYSYDVRDKVHVMSVKKNGKLIYKQLDLLMNAEDWTMDINNQIVDNLINSQELHTIALFMIEFTADEIENDEELDKTHTPPAPMMMRSEQKIATLILSISKSYPEFIDIVIEGIQYKLFRLGSPQMVQIVERLFRILVVLSKIKKDREKVRIFCCDALYCLNLRAVNIIYVALTCWPEILPKYDSNNDVIVKTIVHIVMTLQVTKTYAKLNSLRKLLSTYYEYPNSGYMTNSFKVELFKNLQENAPGINTAILLLCKKMGPEWAAENIVRNLKQMIVTQTHPSLYEVLNLFGNILRSFPANDPNNAVGETIDQLCDVLDGNAGEYNLQEGIVSCLLSISKFKFEQIARTVIKWQSNNDLRPATKDKLKSFFKQHDGKWWVKFIQSNFPLPK